MPTRSYSLPIYNPHQWPNFKGKFKLPPKVNYEEEENGINLVQERFPSEFKFSFVKSDNPKKTSIIFQQSQKGT